MRRMLLLFFVLAVISLVMATLVPRAVCSNDHLSASTRTEQPPRGHLDDVTQGFVHLSPSVMSEVNGCSDQFFTVRATVTDARVFSLRFSFNLRVLVLVGAHAGPEPSLHLMRRYAMGDTLFLDGFFNPNFTGTDVEIATLTVRGLDAGIDTQIHLIEALGYGGTPTEMDTIHFVGDTITVISSDPMLMAPAGVIVVPRPRTSIMDSICIDWNPVHFDVQGNPISNPLYTIFYEDEVDDCTWVAGQTYDSVFCTTYMSLDPDDMGLNSVGQFWVVTCTAFRDR